MKKAFVSLIAVITLTTSAVVLQPKIQLTIKESSPHASSHILVGVFDEEVYSCEYIPEFPSICIMMA